MILYVNDKNEIKDVNVTDDLNLLPLVIKDEEDFNPFLNWSTAKICCYKVEVTNDMVTIMTPYRDSRTLDYIDEIGMANDILLGYREVE
jgi:hypothetical protein